MFKNNIIVRCYTTKKDIVCMVQQWNSLLGYFLIWSTIWPSKHDFLRFMEWNQPVVPQSCVQSLFSVYSCNNSFLNDRVEGPINSLAYCSSMLSCQMASCCHFDRFVESTHGDHWPICLITNSVFSIMQCPWSKNIILRLSWEHLFDFCMIG